MAKKKYISDKVSTRVMFIDWKMHFYSIPPANVTAIGTEKGRKKATWSKANIALKPAI